MRFGLQTWLFRLKDQKPCHREQAAQGFQLSPHAHRFFFFFDHFEFETVTCSSLLDSSMAVNTHKQTLIWCEFVLIVFQPLLGAVLLQSLCCKTLKWCNVLVSFGSM